MKDYPQLAEMGVTHPRQIEKFLINGISNYDVLRIIYNRRKGSFLPVSRSYKFPRIQKSVTGNSTEGVMESNPALRAAIGELKSLLGEKEHKQDVAASILDELRLLEEDIALRSGYIKELAKRI